MNRNERLHCSAECTASEIETDSNECWCRTSRDWQSSLRSQALKVRWRLYKGVVWMHSVRWIGGRGSTMEQDKLFELIRDRLDPDEIVDLCGIGVGELTLRLRGNILANRERFEDYLDIYDET